MALLRIVLVVAACCASNAFSTELLVPSSLSTLQVCRVDRLSHCALELSSYWKGELGLSEKSHQASDPKSALERLEIALRRQLAGQGGVTLLEDDQALIILDPGALEPSSVLLDELVYHPKPVRSLLTTYYHELGHVVSQDLVWPSHLSHLGSWQWRQEVNADLYLLWQSLREGKAMAELWELVHWRNLGLIRSKADWDHWTTPVVMPLLCQGERLYVLSKLGSDEFIKEALANAKVPPLNAFRVIGERQFLLTQPKVSQPYLGEPHRSHWSALLQPTMVWLGVDVQSYFLRHHFEVHDNPCKSLLSTSPKTSQTK